MNEPGQNLVPGTESEYVVPAVNDQSNEEGTGQTVLNGLNSVGNVLTNVSSTVYNGSRTIARKTLRSPMWILNNLANDCNPSTPDNIWSLGTIPCMLLFASIIILTFMLVLFLYNLFRKEHFEPIDPDGDGVAGNNKSWREKLMDVGGDLQMLSQKDTQCHIYANDQDTAPMWIEDTLNAKPINKNLEIEPQSLVDIAPVNNQSSVDNESLVPEQFRRVEKREQEAFRVLNKMNHELTRRSAADDDGFSEKMSWDVHWREYQRSHPCSN